MLEGGVGVPVSRDSVLFLDDGYELPGLQGRLSWSELLGSG